jgi:hypothetical protein
LKSGVQLASTLADHVMIGTVAAWAAKAIGPPPGLDRLGALGLAAEVAEELRGRHALLELNVVAGRGARSVASELPDYSSTGSWDESAEASFQSGN